MATTAKLSEKHTHTKLLYTDVLQFGVVLDEIYAQVPQIVQEFSLKH